MATSIVIGNDFHGNVDIIKRFLARVPDGDCVFVGNGDIVGSRGEKSSRIVAAFYDYRGGKIPFAELRDIILEYDAKFVLDEKIAATAIHSGTFLKYLKVKSPVLSQIIWREIIANFGMLGTITKKLGKNWLYVPGNGENAVTDFDISSGVDHEILPPIGHRFFDLFEQRDGFERIGVDYVSNLRLLDDGILLIAYNAVSLFGCGIDCVSGQIDCSRVRTVITHYPPMNAQLAQLLERFGGKSNTATVEMMDATRRILMLFPRLERVYFGHFHREISEKGLSALPSSFTYIDENEVELCWNKPGAVLKINTPSA